MADKVTIQLTQQEKEDFYQHDVKSASNFREASPQEAPKLWISGGQGGAGKSSVVRRFDELVNNDKVEIDSDNYRKDHPAHEFYVNAYGDREASGMVHEDVTEAVERLYSESLQDHKNIMLSQTCTNFDRTKAQVDQAREAGYERITLQVIATPNEESLYRINKRYEEQKAVDGVGRYLPDQYHDDMYSKFPESLERYEKEKVFDEIVITNHKGEVVYENQLVNNEWEQEPIAVKVLEQYRNIDYTPQEVLDFHAKWEDDVELRMTSRPIDPHSPNEREEVKRLEDKSLQIIIHKALEINKITQKDVDAILDTIAERREQPLYNAKKFEPSQTYTGIVRAINDDNFITQDREKLTLHETVEGIQKNDRGTAVQIHYDDKGKGKRQEITFSPEIKQAMQAIKETLAEGDKNHYSHNDLKAKIERQISDIANGHISPRIERNEQQTPEISQSKPQEKSSPDR